MLEARKKRFARGFCWTFGVVGALVLGAGMSLCLLNPTAAMMAVGVAVGVVGLGLCGSNLPIYRALAARGERRVEPLVAARRDEVAALCEEAQKYR